MRQPLEQRYQRDHETREKDIEGHVTLCVPEWIPAVQDQDLHAFEQEVGQRAGNDR